MAAAPSPARQAAGPELLSIGQVLARLSPEFPDLSPSKLRFLEERHLVTPSRTESGYRSSRRPISNGCASCSPCSATTTFRSR